VRIISLNNDNSMVRQVAELLVEGFKDTGSVDWTTLDSAIVEVRDSLGEDRISRIAIDERGNVLGWIGGIKKYNGNVWELHPLVVRRDCSGKGIGRALVEDFEKEVKIRGGITIYLGADDENKRTSLGGIDLYPDVLNHILQIRNLGDHPFEFYQKLGFIITGVIPDANGLGKPDIIMTKRVA
jgi:aminoglycoside 6'-N-acetyltransferase I